MLARRIQDVIGRPWTRDYVKIVDGSMVQNCPLVRADVSAAQDILGPNLGSNHSLGFGSADCMFWLQEFPHTS